MDRDERVEQIWEALLSCLPRFVPVERQVALALYRALAEGREVRREELARRLGWRTPDVVDLLEGKALRGLTLYDAHRQVIGFGGLAVTEMPHRFEAGGRLLYTWCAWDGLFLPALLGAEGRITSRCPRTKLLIELTAGEEGVHAASHPGAVVSFVVPEAAAFGGDPEKAMARFCHHVYFLASREAGAEWIASRDDLVILSLDQAFELGRRKNALQFPELAKARPDKSVEGPGRSC